MRLFLGLPLPQPWQDGLARLAADFSRPSPDQPGAARLVWTRPTNWHLTLRFLGETDEAGRDAVIEAAGAALAALPFVPFALRAAGGGAFPSTARPRVLFAGLAEGAEQCRALAACLEEAARRAGFAPEARPFVPHLTVARVKDRAQPASRTDSRFPALLDALDRTVWPVARVDEVVLWRSETGQGGPRYTRLAAFPASGC